MHVNGNELASNAVCVVPVLIWIGIRVLLLHPNLQDQMGALVR